MEIKNDKNYFTADYARQLTESSTVIIERIYKFIKEATYEGKCSTIYSFDYEDKKLLSKAVEELREKGFTVEMTLEEPYDQGMGYMTISW